MASQSIPGMSGFSAFNNTALPKGFAPVITAKEASTLRVSTAANQATSLLAESSPAPSLSPSPIIRTYNTYVPSRARAIAKIFFATLGILAGVGSMVLGGLALATGIGIPIGAGMIAGGAALTGASVFGMRSGVRELRNFNNYYQRL